MKKNRSVLPAVTLWVLLALWLPAGLVAQTLHVLTFCDTDDSTIGTAAAAGAKFVQNELAGRVAYATGMAVRNYPLHGSSFTLAQVKSQLSSFSCGSNDAIFVWIEAHGYNNGSSEWPMISCKGFESAQARSLALQDIYTTLTNKGARLTIVVANACNTPVPTRQQVNSEPYVVHNGTEGDDNYALLKDLFLYSKGSAMLAGCKKGEKSFSNTATGSYLYLKFKETFDKQVVGSSATWESLFSGTATLVSDLASGKGYDQHPIRYVSVATTRPADQPTAYTETANGVSFTMRYVPGGTFTMGSNDTEARSDEQPTHTVALSSFWMAETEVTQALWRSVMGTAPSYFKNCDQCPVENVSWNDAQAFIKKLNSLTGKNYRLPTEAEWEYAAGGGNSGYASNGIGTLSNSSRTKYGGTSNEGSLGSYAWYNTNSSSTTHPVAQKQPNRLGLYDMSGNVFEWCQDWIKGYPGSSGVGDYTGSYLVLRGGSWRSESYYCRAAFRGNNAPGTGSSDGGFRLCLSV